MKRNQSGVSMSGLLVIAFILAVISLVGMKVAPAFIEYYQIVSTVKKIAGDPNAKGSVAELRKAFNKQADIDSIKAITAQDLDISKDSGTVVVAFAYESRIPLFANISLLIEFQGSSGE